MEVRKRPQHLSMNSSKICREVSRTSRKYKLLCVYLILAHFCIIYLCIWSSARHFRKLRTAQSRTGHNTASHMHNIQEQTQPLALYASDLKTSSSSEHYVNSNTFPGIQETDVAEMNVPETLAKNASCPLLRAIFILANYSSIQRRLYYSEYHTVIFKFVYSLTCDWISNKHATNDINNIVKFAILTPEIEMWPDACMDYEQVNAHRSIDTHDHNHDHNHAAMFSAMCRVDSFTNFQALTKNSQSILDLMQQQFITEDLCLEWREAILLILNDVDIIQFDHLTLSRISGAQNARATCLFRQSHLLPSPKCLMSVWKI